jgi:hypothetical protein
VIPTNDHAAIKRLADRNDRSLTAEVLRAVRAYSARPDLAEKTLGELFEESASA